MLVVGAGPAGSAAAYHLAKHGVDVLMVDKERFPREKVCGDGLTPRAVSALEDMGVDTSDPGFTRNDGLRAHGADGVVLELPWPSLRTWPAYGLVRTRLDFDDMLATMAVKAGARFLQGVEAGEPVLVDGWVSGARLADDGGEPLEVRARFVIAADGAPSRLGSRVGVRRDAGRAIGVAARRYYRSPRPFEPFMESFLCLDGPAGLMPGYGWIFFLPDGVVNVGAGLLSTFKGFRRTSARKVFDAFAKGLPSSWGISEENAIGPVMSGPLPTAMNRQPAAVPGMLLVGDAAGMVNPFNGEGISGALESGKLAAELVTGSLVNSRSGIAQMYPVLLRERYGRYYHAGNAWARLIGNPAFMRFAVRHGVPRRRLMEFALRMLANLTDGKDGDVDDRIMHALIAAIPGRLR